MPEAIPSDSAEFKRVLAVMERLAASSDLHEVLGLIVDSLRDVLGAERASVFQYDPESHELFATEAHGVDASLRFGADSGLAGQAVASRRIINVPDCYSDARFNRDVDRRTGFTTRCMLTVPLVSFDGTVEGVAQVLNKVSSPGAVFGPADEALARALASQAAVALKRARLIEAERRKDKIEADLRIARQIQRAAIPQTLPDIAGYELAAETIPAEETGGDCFDLISLPGPSGADRLWVLMADASGHGVGPAMSVMQAQSMFRMGAALGAPLDDLARRINSLLHAALPVGRFITAFIGLLDPASGRLAYAAAGQAPTLVLRAGGAVDRLDANAAPLGIDAGFEMDPVEPIILSRGDTLLLLSDGYFERLNDRDALLGVDAVAASALAARESAADVLAAVRDAATTHAAGRPPADDQTGVVIRRLR